MTKTIVILYFVVGIILSIVYTYLDYAANYKLRPHDIDSYFDNEFSVLVILSVILAWPLTLIIFGFTVVLPGFYMITVIILDKFFGGRKK